MFFFFFSYLSDNSKYPNGNVIPSIPHVPYPSSEWDFCVTEYNLKEILKSCLWVRSLYAELDLVYNTTWHCHKFTVSLDEGSTCFSTKPLWLSTHFIIFVIFICDWWLPWSISLFNRVCVNLFQINGKHIWIMTQMRFAFSKLSFSLNVNFHECYSRCKNVHLLCKSSRQNSNCINNPTGADKNNHRSLWNIWVIWFQSATCVESWTLFIEHQFSSFVVYKKTWIE